MIFSYKLDLIVTTAAAAVFLVLWSRERRLHRDDVERFYKEVERLQKLQDPERSSSGLTPRGDPPMMTEPVVFAAARFGLGLGLLAFGCLYMVRKTRLDVFRSSLFAIRDQMFYDLACRGRLSDCPAYQQLRDEINGLLRFAHQFDLMSLLFTTVLMARDQDKPDSNLLDAIQAESDPEVRQYLLNVYREVGRRAMRHVALGGSQIFLMLPVLLVYVLCKRGGRWISELPPDMADKLAALGRDDSGEARLLLAA